MKCLLAVLFILLGINTEGQTVVAAAKAFISCLDETQKTNALFPFDSDERYNFHFFPKSDRKGVSLNEMSARQKEAALGLMKACLSESGVQKAQAIVQLEAVLKEVERRSSKDQYRDPGAYYFTIFGTPAANAVWGWRLEGHHLSFTFSAKQNKLISGTPAFMGANPALVPSGPKKGTQVLKEEANVAFALLHSLSAVQLQQALVDTTAPNEIITFVSRSALIEHPAGIEYNKLNAAQQQQLMQLIGVYVHRYTKLFAEAMLKEIKAAGLEHLRFAWAGTTNPNVGKPHYYRIQGPTFIIEYDNAQSNANHVHSVLRDLKHDFGGDALLEHYNAAHR